MRHLTGRNMTAMALVISCASFPERAPAQSTPAYQEIDPNGVDVINGTFHAAGPSLSIGDASNHLTVAPDYNNLFDTTPAPILYSTWSSYDVDVGYNNKYEHFIGNVSHSYTPNASGATLVYNSTTNTYTYTAANGTIIVFDTTINQVAFSFSVLAKYIKFPDGEQIDYTYVTKTISLPLSGGYTYTYNITKILNARSNYGYDVRYIGDYSLNDSNSWVSVKAINRSIDYCDPTAEGCSTSTSWPSLTASRPDGNTTNITDQNGNVWGYTLTGYARVIGIKKPGSTSDNIVVSYNTDTSVASVAIDGRTWTYSYTKNYSATPPAGTTTVTDPASHSRTYYYNLNSYLTAVTDELGHTTSYGHDSAGRVNSITTPEGVVSQLGYDGRGNQTSLTIMPKPGSGATNITTSASFPSSCTNIVTCNQPTATIDALGNQTDYTYDSTTGLVTSVTAPAPTTGAVRPQTRYSYTSLQAYVKNAGGTIAATGLPVSKLTAVSQCQTTSSCASGSDEVRTTTDYGPQTSGTANNLLPVSVTSGSGNGTLLATTTTAYDAVGNAISIDGPISGNADTTVIRYDAGRRVVGVIGPDPDGSGALKNRARRVTYSATDDITLDERGSVAGQSDSAWAAFSPLQAVSTSYDPSGRPLVKSSISGSSTYDLTQYSYDSLGRLDCVAVRMNSATWTSLPSSACTAATGGAAGPDRITKRTYDAASQVTKVQSAYGTADQSDDENYTYNADGTKATFIDAQVNKTSYTYDGFDRLFQTFYPVATAGAGTSSSTDYEQLSYDAAGHITSRRLRDGNSIGYAYDANDRLTYKDLPGSELDVTYTYDNLGHLKTATDAGSNYVGFAYDALGRPIAQSSPLGVVGMGYDLAGRRTLTVWPDSFYVTYGYDTAGELTAVRENGASSGVGVLASYSYDDLGRRTSVVRGNGTSTTYGFDSVSRLTSLAQDLDGSGTTNDLSLGFSYSPAGQITATTRSNNAYAWGAAANRNDASSVNGLNQTTSVGAGSIGYDTKGNLSTAGSSTFTYSSQNLLLTGPASTSLAYDPMLRLYQESSGSGTTRFQYDGTGIIGEYDIYGTLQKRYVMGLDGDEPLIEYDKSGGGFTRIWLHADERGSIVAESSDSGATTAINSYDEYGVPASGNVGRFQYTGQTYLPSLGMYNYKARIYSSRLGKFMQTDPIGYSDGQNWYNYVHSDPINKIDAGGMELCDLNSLGYSKGSGCGSEVTVVGGGLFGTTVGLGATNTLFNFGNLGTNLGNSPIGNIAKQIQDDSRKSDTIAELRKRAAKICAPNPTSEACRAAIKAANDAYTADAKLHPGPFVYTPPPDTRALPQIGRALETNFKIGACAFGLGATIGTSGLELLVGGSYTYAACSEMYSGL